MNEISLPDAIEPSCWYVAFHERTTNRIAALCPGRFKHVSAFAYYPGFKSWLYVDPQFGRLRLLMIAHDQRKLLLDEIASAALVRFEIASLQSFSFRFGLYCVPQIKYLLGLSCVAARPDALYRHILKNGGILIDGRHSLSTAASGRPQPAS